MKKESIIALTFLLFLLLLNVFSFLNINNRFVGFLNSTLESQTNLCGEYMEKKLTAFESDLNKLLFEYEFGRIFKDPEVMEKSNRSLQVFYARYEELISNISIYDNKKNYFGLYINESDRFVVDTFPRQSQVSLSPRDKVTQVQGKYLYHYPYFENDAVVGNIIVEVDFKPFSEQVFNLYPRDKTISWQWMINNEGEILNQNFGDTMRFTRVGQIADSIDMEAGGIIKHEVHDTTGAQDKVYSAYYPMSIFKKQVGIVFTASQRVFNQFFILRNLLVTILSLLATLGIVVYLLISLRRQTRNQENLKVSEIVYRQILENFPVGLMILDDQNIIRNINSTAQDFLFVGKSENLVGKDFNKQFLVSNKYLLKENVNSLDNSQYLYYEKDGIETVIFRVEQSTRIGGEELRLIALIDVSSIEKSRKQEVAANRAKSDFLAAMSHEIRTPMNGILGMISDMLEEDLDDSLEEKVRVLKKSSDLLMTIINDILDFSKIEAGKMMLEEIPYSLTEEINLVVELFNPLAGEKGLDIQTDIKPDVPDSLIGDPFRLRQVISNLVSNAVKFTHQGRILIGVELMEKFKSNLSLLFYVEDTGVGIPRDKIKEIFASYSQAGGSVSRKFGGTGLGTAIAKQLVEMMNGEIWVESPSRISTNKEEAPGSRFSFTIEAFSNEKIRKNYNFEGITKLSQITALYFTKESNPSKNSITKVLDSFGLNVVTKIYQDSTIDSVVHHVDVKRDMYQMLILADTHKLDGFALAHRLKEEELTDFFPVILVSSNDKPGNYKICKRLGIDYYLIEPFESKEVFDIISENFPNIGDQKSVQYMLNALPEQLSILLAEDNIINQKVAQSIFKNIGYEIDLARNGVEAVKLAEEKKHDVVFMDLLMPEMDGFQAAEKIRELGLEMPIVAMSADDDDQRKADAILSGMDEYLSKPARVEKIKQLLIKLFSKSIQ